MRLAKLDSLPLPRAELLAICYTESKAADMQQLNGGIVGVNGGDGGSKSLLCVVMCRVMLK